jgi:hypothetical protein
LLLLLRCGLTEWEREREREEFSKAAMLYQPLKGEIAARFTRGRNIDDDVSDKVCSHYFFLLSFIVENTSTIWLKVKESLTG